jgi:hypothetical protein
MLQFSISTNYHSNIEIQYSLCWRKHQRGSCWAPVLPWSRGGGIFRKLSVAIPLSSANQELAWSSSVYEQLVQENRVSSSLLDLLLRFACVRCRWRPHWLVSNYQPVNPYLTEFSRLDCGQYAESRASTCVEVVIPQSV